MKLSRIFNVLANIIIALIVALCAVIMLPKVFGYEVYGILVVVCCKLSYWKYYICAT